MNRSVDHVDIPSSSRMLTVAVLGLTTSKPARTIVSSRLTTNDSTTSKATLSSTRLREAERLVSDEVKERVVLIPAGADNTMPV